MLNSQRFSTRGEWTIASLRTSSFSLQVSFTSCQIIQRKIQKFTILGWSESMAASRTLTILKAFVWQTEFQSEGKIALSQEWNFKFWMKQFFIKKRNDFYWAFFFLKRGIQYQSLYQTSCAGKIQFRAFQAPEWKSTRWGSIDDMSKKPTLRCLNSSVLFLKYGSLRSFCPFFLHWVLLCFASILQDRFCLHWLWICTCPLFRLSVNSQIWYLPHCLIVPFRWVKIFFNLAKKEGLKRALSSAKKISTKFLLSGIWGRHPLALLARRKWCSF